MEQMILAPGFNDCIFALLFFLSTTSFHLLGMRWYLELDSLYSMYEFVIFHRVFV